MSKVTVVVQAPFPVVVDNGRHLATGEIASVERDEYIEGCISENKLAVVPEASKPEPAPKAETPPTRKIENS